MLLLQLEFTRRLRRLGFWKTSRSRVATSICTKQPSLGTSGAGGVDDCSRRVCCSFSRRTWRSVSREVQNCVASVCDGYLASLGLDVQGYYFFELGVRRKWTDFQVFERLVFLVRLRGTTLHGGLVVRRSPSQSLRFFFSVASSTQSQRCSRCAATS